MGFEDTETETTAADDAPVDGEVQGIDPEDLNMDFNDDEVEKAARVNPIPNGRQRVRIVDGALKQTGDKSNAPGRPYFNYQMELVDAPEGEDFDKLFHMVFFPWEDDEGKRHRGRMHMQGLQEFEAATGIKIAGGGSAADIIEAAKGLELDVVIKQETFRKIKQARIDRFA